MLEIEFGSYPQAFLLALARVGAVLWVLQYLGGAQMPTIFKMALAMVVTFGLMPMIPATWMVEAGRLDNLVSVAAAMVQEVMIGACLGLACELILAAMSMAGVLIGMGSSLMMARGIDPASGTSVSIPQQILVSVFMMFLLLTNTHLELIRMLGDSFVRVPILSSWEGEEIFGMIVAAGAQMFEWGLRLAMPIVATAMLLDACLGLMAKLAPDFDILFLSLPIRLFVGLSLIGLTIQISGGVFSLMKDRMVWIYARVLGG